jgi:hypothetical protein
VPDRPPVAELIAALAAQLGVPRFVSVCTDLMGGADREEYVEELRGLTGHGSLPGDGVLDRNSWHDYWLRTWGARGLLHVWDESATDAVVLGLADEHWRPAEMCLKVTTRHEVAGTGDGAAVLAGHELPRDHLDDEDEAVRRQASKALTALEQRLDLA